MNNIKLLVAEDDAVDQMAFRRFVQQTGLPYKCRFVRSVAEAREILAVEEFDAVLSDYILSDGTALDLLRVVGDTPTIVITGSGNEEIAVRAMRAGAYDYLIKDPTGSYLKTLAVTLEHVLDRHQAAEELRRYQEYLEDLVKQRTAELAAANERLAAEIAERKRAERIVQEQLNLLRTIINASPDVVCLKDGQGRWMEANKSCQRLFDLDETGYRGKTDVELAAVTRSHRETLLALHADDEAVWQRGVVTRGEMVIPMPDSRPLVYDTLKVPLFNPDGSRKWLVMMGRDITQQKRAEEAMRQQERLAAVGQLAGGIAHDFNNFLTIITLHSQMPLRRHDDLPEDVQRAFRVILDESRKAAQLVQQILDFSRRSPLKAHVMDLRPFIKEAVRVLQRTIPESISILLDVGDGEYRVRADPARIQQALMNIVFNARDAMPDGGRLTITLSSVQSPLPDDRHLICPDAHEETARWVRLSVADTGPGIPPDLLPHIFEPFFTTKPAEKGAGLGLAQVYGIVAQHNGCIGVETELGQGTTFHIYLPAVAEAQEKESAPRLETPSGNGETILLVEDNDLVRDVSRGMLEVLGYRVLTASNGREALATYRPHADEVDLVLTDVVMPEMGCRELVAALKEIREDVRVIAATGYALAEEVEDLRRIGVIEVISKPFDLASLAQAVRYALSR